MRIWKNIKKRIGKAGQAKEMKKKAVARLELVGAGALLTGGLVLMARLTEDDSPSLSGQDIVHNSDTFPVIFKFESLSKGSKMSILEMLGWVLFGFFILLFIIPVLRAIKKIMKICNKNTDAYNLETRT